MVGYPAKMSSKGQVTIPKEIRKHLGVGRDTVVNFVINHDGSVIVQKSFAEQVFRKAMEHPFIQLFIRNYPEGELRASMYIGAIIQSGQLSSSLLDELKDVKTIEILIKEYTG
ncbi:AbrB/MazE/SpoVT family DNA-binding domain-containing protein [Paenibacillus sp. GYB004]|uniref:AbrB/MazE/SpoVT family DNA-binding domain-containing protein n=1 Tax=Paenibacillus sp. GYB004 TaxID=2994393 RepID=UPI002F96E077